MGSKKVTLTIDGIDANEKKSSTKIQYVNPNVSDDVMRTFANKCAALSTDTHTATTKTTDEDITTAPTPKPKLSITLGSQPKLSEPNTNVVFNEAELPDFTYKLSATTPQDEMAFASAAVAFFTYSGNVNYSIGKIEDWSWSSEKLIATFYFEETETTAATTATLTINATTNPVLTIL